MADSVSILDHPIISSRYFYPQSVAFAEPYWVEAADGSRLACSYRAVQPDDAKTVVYFHSNGEVVTNYLPGFANWFNGMGYNLLLAEYRGYGMSAGTPALAGMLDDVEPFLDSLQIPDEKTILFGRSIGSLYAVHGVARRPQLGGLIIESGVADLSQRFFQRVLPEELGVSETDLLEELHKHFDAKKKLSGFQGKTLVLHARHDEIIDAQHAEMLYAAVQEPKQLKIFEQGGHNDIFYRNQVEYVQLVEDFLATV